MPDTKIDPVDRQIGEMLLSDKKPTPFLEILSVKEREEKGGYCRTCEYTDHFVVVCYLDMNEEVQSKEFWVSYHELLRELLEFDMEDWAEIEPHWADYHDDDWD